MIFIIAIIVGFTSGCINSSYYSSSTVFNRDDTQDGDCWRSYGAEWGYCTKEYHREN